VIGKVDVGSDGSDEKDGSDVGNEKDGAVGSAETGRFRIESLAEED
jgi:hypothetical protein